MVAQNFTGCMENLYFNSTNIMLDMRQAFEEGEALRYMKVNTMYTCPEPPIIPVTFLTSKAHARLRGYEGVNSMNVSFSFRTYEENGMMLYHEFLSNGHVKVYLEDGKVKVELITENNPIAILDNYEEAFNDGKWHNLVLTISTNLLVLDIDKRPMRTVRILSMQTGSLYLIAGKSSTHQIRDRSKLWSGKNLNSKLQVERTSPVSSVACA